jgi:HPt (histidine-containing phosphotransfer) domain-containing protein
MDDLTSAIDRVAITPLAGSGEPIDRKHLARMTLGDLSLEREVLTLFDRQANMLLARMTSAEPAVVAALAHTIKGSARGIGAFGVAYAAEAVELAADGLPLDLAGDIGRLAATIEETRRVIGELLRAH